MSVSNWVEHIACPQFGSFWWLRRRAPRGDYNSEWAPPIRKWVMVPCLGVSRFLNGKSYIHKTRNLHRPELPYEMVCFKLRQGKTPAYIDFVSSDEARQLFTKIEKETSFKYLNTYFCTAPAVDPDYDVYEIWEFPNMAAYDKLRESEVFRKFLDRINDMLNLDKPTKILTLRTAKER